MAKKTKVPFGMMPASWGLKGKTRAIAEAEYYYEGNELEEILATLNADTDIDKEVAKLDVQFKNGDIGKYEHEKQIAELKNEVASLSVGIAEKILKGELSDKSKQDALVDNLIDDVNLN